MLVHFVEGRTVFFGEVFGDDDVIHNEKIEVVFVDEDAIHGDPLDVFELDAAAGWLGDGVRIAVAVEHFADGRAEHDFIEVEPRHRREGCTQ